MICYKKNTPIQPYMEYLCIFVAYINELASIERIKRSVSSKPNDAKKQWVLLVSQKVI